MVQQWRAASFWLRDHQRVTNATWFTPRDPRLKIRRAGVLVLCGIGHEEEAIAVGIPEISGACAARGLISMSIDFAGNGQSLDDLEQPKIVQLWRQQIATAIAHLRNSGAEKVAVIAPRLAAALAVGVVEKSPVEALVLWSPVLSGRRYLRELRMMQRVGATAPDVNEGDIAVGSFKLPAVVVDAIEQIETANIEAAPAPAILYVESPDRPVEDRAVARMRDLGADVVVRQGKDTTLWLFTASDNSTVPFESARGVAAWIDDRLAVVGSAEPVDTRSLSKSTSFWFSGHEIQESFIPVGALGLSGVLVEPASPDPSLASVLYLSMGPGRSFVRAARQAASEGRRALRFDFAGFGLSPLRPTQSEPELYGPSGGDDVRLGVEQLLARGASSVVVVGFCAGAWSSIVCTPIPGVVAIAAINVHLSVRLRRFAERSKNNQTWQRDLVVPGRRTLLDRVRDRVERMRISAGPPVGWLTALGQAGVLVGLFFDAHDLGFQYWQKAVSRHFRRQIDQGTIEVRTYTGLGHLAEGQVARRLVFQDIYQFIRRSDVAKEVASRIASSSSGLVR